MFIHENAIESVVCEMVAILSRPQCVKTGKPQHSWAVSCMNRFYQQHKHYKIQQSIRHEIDKDGWVTAHFTCLRLSENRVLKLRPLYSHINCSLELHR